MVSHHPAKFGKHRHCGSEDIIFLLAGEQDSRCSSFNPPLLFMSKFVAWKHTAYYIDKSVLGHTRLKQY